MKKKIINKFFDINKLPAKEGILIFPISMSKISNSQSAKKCWEYMKIFSPKKIIKPVVGLNIIYGDNLYFNSNTKASLLKNKFIPLIVSHKNEILKIIKRNPLYIEKSFSFMTWSQTILNCKDFTNYYGKIKKLYEKDKNFKKYLLEDFKQFKKRKITQNNINFLLEETLIFYLLIKGKIKLPNEYINNNEKWILWCYPGKPLKSQIYILQKNPFNFENTKNDYESAFYDLSEKKLYNFRKIEIEKLEL